MEWNVCSAEIRTNIAKIERDIQCVYMLIAFSYLPGKPLPQAIHLPPPPPPPQVEKLGEVA